MEPPAQTDRLIMSSSGPIETEIRTLLTQAFAPTALDVSNDSAMHSGHMGDDGSGESHFTVTIESAEFTGKNRLARQRAVIAALGDIPGQRVHALAIKARAPGEA
ncbi:BolA family protein [Croceicoccus mobilis]|uniref:BolA family transcriptional regulator n=1 Tax=Croceicoccus mobilis TaxID=1703339 RepID=A0A916Z706_9SPHN|nr:BolA family protein [Croceicoccus mobilis]GGD77487.1 BolA family transcriptional regulator [Croceicoccus mobilis]